MYLEEILLAQDAPLLQDGYSGTLLGEGSHLIVVGWCGRKQNRSHKLYVVQCDKCKQDQEMYGDGYFTSEKHDLVVGKIPCGCSTHSWKTERQWEILAERAANILGYSFEGWAEPFKGNVTRCKFSCAEHGTWETAVLTQLLNANTVCCPALRANKASLRKRKPDQEMINSFLITGSYADGTSFVRSEKVNKRGQKRRWVVSCPVCDVTYDSDYNSLQKGLLGCQCSAHFYSECYINLVSSDDIPLCLKFGVSKDSKRRVKEQHRASGLQVSSLGVWRFESKELCSKSEKECLSSLSCGIVSPAELPDGFTETTYLYNLDKIISIYEKNGGVRVDD